MKKITKATFKSFIRKNEGKLYIMCKSNFDSQDDCVRGNENRSFKLAIKKEEFTKNTLGIKGIWLVGGSGNYFDKYEDENYTGIELYNCCGSQIIAVQKQSHGDI